MGCVQKRHFPQKEDADRCPQERPSVGGLKSDHCHSGQGCDGAEQGQAEGFHELFRFLASSSIFKIIQGQSQGHR